nr:hypothetical protein [Tanacetum cinerariifolium]
MLRQREHAANLRTRTLEPLRRFNCICHDDDDDYDDKESSILIMRDEDLSTIPEKESDEFIKSSVKDLVPILSESEDTFDSDKECDLPFCDNSMTFYNLLFNLNDYFTSSDDESLSDEDILDKKFKIYSNPPFEFDDEYISSDVNPLFVEVGDIDEINAFDISMDIEYGYHDSEGDIIYLESLLTNDTIPSLPSEVFQDHNPRSLKDEPDNLKSMVKVFDPRIQEKKFIQH